ncbi:MAG: phosphomethylpyrimidine synthase ThiC [Methanolinea sp.]|nr:phosphomethylpyrimidine synthase ThiC [Methanolinea sp.]
MNHLSDPSLIETVAASEGLEPRELAVRVADGSVVLMRRGPRAVGIGRGLRVKVNVNIGTSDHHSSPEEEVEKAVIAERYGADTISDLSMGESVRETRQRIMDHTAVPPNDSSCLPGCIRTRNRGNNSRLCLCDSS